MSIDEHLAAVPISATKKREMRKFVPSAVLAVLGSTMPAMAQDVTARELNNIELVRLIGSRVVPNAEQLNKLELSLISTHQGVPLAANAALGHGTAPPVQQVNNIWWNVVSPYGYPLCAAEQSGARPVYATFGIYPACLKLNANCTVHGTRYATLYSNVPTPVWPWLPEETLHPQCSLISWQYPAEPPDLSAR